MSFIPSLSEDAKKGASGSQPPEPEKGNVEPGKLGLPPVMTPAGKVDPEVFTAWKEHMIRGYQQNNEMFQQLLNAFMRPYWMTVWMYRVMFAVGIGGFLLSAVLAVWRGIEFGVLFGGLSVFAFLTYFVSQPLRSLEQNIQFITWLGIIYNTYWTRLMYANDTANVQGELEAIAQRAIEDIDRLVNKQVEISGKRPSLPSEPPKPEPVDQMP